jgi:hypothetical protein
MTNSTPLTPEQALEIAKQLPNTIQTAVTAVTAALVSIITIIRFLRGLNIGGLLGGLKEALHLTSTAKSLTPTNPPAQPSTGSDVKQFLVLLGLAALTFTASAQTTNSPLSNPFFSALNSVVIDTNSTFFAGEHFQLRSALLENNNTAADFGADYNLSPTWQIGGDVCTRGAANVVSEAGLDTAYRISIHNMELDPLIGASWSWDDNVPYLRAGIRLEYVLSGRSFAFVQPELREDMTQWNRPTAQIQIGVGFAF